MNSISNQTLLTILEISKILGPAIITGLLAYMLAKAQFKNSLHQLDLANELKARMTMFDYYQARINEANNAFSTFSEKLTKLETFVMSASVEELGSYGVNNFWKDFNNLHHFLLTLSFRETRSDFEELSPNEKDATMEMKIAEIEKVLSNLARANDRVETLNITARLRELHAIHLYCLHCQLEKYGVSVFDKYLKS